MNENINTGILILTQTLVVEIQSIAIQRKR